MLLSLTFAHVLWALMIAFAFVAWPIASKFSGVSGAWVNVIILAASTVSGAIASYPSMKQEPLPSLKGVVIVALAGLFNGVAVYVYSLKTVDREIPTAAFMTTTIVLMVALTPVLNYFVNREVVTAWQWAGLLAAFVAIYCFTR